MRSIGAGPAYPATVPAGAVSGLFGGLGSFGVVGALVDPAQ